MINFSAGGMDSPESLPVGKTLGIYNSLAHSCTSIPLLLKIWEILLVKLKHKHVVC